MPVHPLVREVVESYLSLVDAEAPGLVEGLYLEGSVALGDFRPHTSDIDFVAVTAEPPDAAALIALEQVHGRLKALRRRPFFDGTYVTRQDLARDPATATRSVTCHEGRFEVAEGGGHSEVTWHTLAHHGVACRGPAAADLDVRTDPEALAAAQVGNLDDYWARLLTRAARLPSRSGLFSLTDYCTAWTVTGVSRLHYTLSTGRITSKTGAAEHARRTFPDRWHRVVDESLRIRHAAPGRSHYRNPLARRRDVLAFGGMVVADAHRVHAARLKSEG